MPEHMTKMQETKFKANGITDLSNYNLVSLYQMTIKLIQNHCKIQELKKHMKQVEKTSFQKYCKHQPQLFRCHNSLYA